MKNILLVILFIILIVWASFNQLAHQLIFHPKSEVIYRPKYQYENIYLSWENNEPIKHHDKNHGINAWYFNNYPNEKTVLYFHGNYGNLSYSSHIIELCHKFNLNLLMIDYQGFGKSNGCCSIDNLFDDSYLAYSFIRKHVTIENIIIWGESLGGVPASYLASKFPCRCLVLLSTFSTPDDMNRYGFKNELISLGIKCFDTSKLLNINRMKHISCPVLIVHSSEDNLIPYECGKLNYESIPHNFKKFITIKGEHSFPHISRNNMKTLLEFCDSSYLNLNRSNLQLGLKRVNKCIKRSNQ